MAVTKNMEEVCVTQAHLYITSDHEIRIGEVVMLWYRLNCRRFMVIDERISIEHFTANDLCFMRVVMRLIPLFAFDYDRRVRGRAFKSL